MHFRAKIKIKLPCALGKTSSNRGSIIGSSISSISYGSNSKKCYLFI